VSLGRCDYIPTDASFGVIVVILLTAVGSPSASTVDPHWSVYYWMNGSSNGPPMRWAVDSCDRKLLFGLLANLENNE